MDLAFLSSKVSDGSPHPGMHVHPVCGCIPVGGVAELTVLFQPNMVGPFDVKLNVLLKEGKSITLRIAGNVDQPVVSIDQVMLLQCSVQTHAVCMRSCFTTYIVCSSSTMTVRFIIQQTKCRIKYDCIVSL